jgi:hypothetical protein
LTDAKNGPFFAVRVNQACYHYSYINMHVMQCNTY